MNKVIIYGSIGEPKFRAKQIYDWMHVKLVEGYEEMTNIPKQLKDFLSENTFFASLKPARVQVSKEDGTAKYLFELYDGNYIESLHAYQTSYTAEDTLVYVATHDVEYVRVCYYSNQGWDIVVLRYNNNTNRISEIQSEALNNLYPSISMFSKVGFCGDSYVEGQIWIGDSSYDHPELSWGSDIGRRAGITAQIYASSGADTALYLTRSACLPAILADATPCGLYVFCLGINDSSTVTTGTIADITDYESYEDYPNTFYGNYGKIIEQILEYSPNSKIIIMTPYHPHFNERYVTPITEITEHYNIAMINTMNSKLCENSTLFRSRLVHSHPTAPLHSAMAKDIEYLIGQCISDNYDYFKTYVGIPSS